MQNSPSVPYPRYRVIDERYVPKTLLTQTDSQAIPPFIENVVSGHYGGRYGHMQDVVTPSFRRLQASGGIVNTGMSSDMDEYTWANVSFTNTEVSPEPGRHIETGTGEHGSFMELAVPTLGLFAKSAPKDGMVLAAQQLAAIQARTNMSKIDVQALVAIAERKKTLELIVDLTKTAGTLLTTILRGPRTGSTMLTEFTRTLKGTAYNPNVFRTKGVPRTENTTVLQGITSRWLQYRYGIIPVVMDIQGLIKALKRKATTPRQTVRGRSVRYSHWAEEESYYFSGSGTAFYDYNHDHKVTARAYCMIEADLKHASARSFGITEIPLAVWELVPFSFVYDWFQNIGNWLEALTPKLGINILAEGVSFLSEYNLVRVVRAWSPATSGASMSSVGYVGSADSRRIVKRGRTPSLTNVLYRLPPLDIKINVTRAIDAIALIVQLYTGRQRVSRVEA